MLAYYASEENGGGRLPIRRHTIRCLKPLKGTFDYMVHVEVNWSRDTTACTNFPTTADYYKTSGFNRFGNLYSLSDERGRISGTKEIIGTHHADSRQVTSLC